jgi:hypothetical protein
MAGHSRRNLRFGPPSRIKHLLAPSDHLGPVGSRVQRPEKDARGQTRGVFTRFVAKTVDSLGQRTRQQSQLGSRLPRPKRFPAAQFILEYLFGSPSH